MFVLLLLKHFRSPAGSRRGILASEYRSGNPAVIDCHENMNLNRKVRKEDGVGSGGAGVRCLKQLLRFESLLMLYIWTLFPFILKHFHSQLKPCVSDLLTLHSSSKCFLMLKKFLSTLGFFFPLSSLGKRLRENYDFRYPRKSSFSNRVLPSDV